MGPRERTGREKEGQWRPELAARGSGCRREGSSDSVDSEDKREGFCSRHAIRKEGSLRDMKRGKGVARRDAATMPDEERQWRPCLACSRKREHV